MLRRIFRRLPRSTAWRAVRSSVLLALCYAFNAGAHNAGDGEANLHLYTEPFPPFSMTIDGSAHAASADNITGFAAETFKELTRRAGVSSTMELVPWARAYAEALENPKHGVFPTFRTPEREALFQWVGPLVENDWVLMARADRKIELETLADAERYRIGAYLGDALAEYLESQGLVLDYVTNDVLNVRKLGRGRIDLWPVVEVDGPPPLAQQEGVAVRKVFTFKRTQMSLALNPDTDPDLVALLQQTLDQMHEDGTVARLEAEFATR